MWYTCQRLKQLRERRIPSPHFLALFNRNFYANGFTVAHNYFGNGVIYKTLAAFGFNDGRNAFWNCFRTPCGIVTTFEIMCNDKCMNGKCAFGGRNP